MLRQKELGQTKLDLKQEQLEEKKLGQQEKYQEVEKELGKELELELKQGLTATVVQE